MCEFCEREFKASETNPHLKDCEEFPIPCPNDCPREEEEGQRELKRNVIPIHLESRQPFSSPESTVCLLDHGRREERYRHTREGIPSHPFQTLYDEDVR